ncbi:M28 family metallopeptidase [Intrasporangium sp.]|jgi:aminopeptidase Y|uniref:M28 family metallopeptidase n=1 Tax=Intrasporangium sp. TaxID=1925024 RepID=UPI0033656505
MSQRTHRTAAAFVAALLAAGGGTAAAVSASAASPACDTRTNNTVKNLLECVTLDGVREHQAALQQIADDNNGTRASGTPGYDASADYVAERLQAAGWNVTRQEFNYQAFINLAPAVVERVSPNPGPIDATTMEYSGSGDVTAAVTALTPFSTDATPGCEASDFAGFTAGRIALIQRGGCAFAIKATNAYHAGAAGVMIYNNIPGALSGTLGNDFALEIPVVQTTQAVGQALAATPGLVMHIKTSTFRGTATTSNVLAELPGKNADNVVMAGAHLDSVDAGPGINDNGSGSSALIEVAENLGKVKPQNTVRFAWWGAEEASLVGSDYYVDHLSQAERDKIALYLNFDMIGSPNHVFFIYDGDDSDRTGAGPGPEGSAQIEKTFEAFFESRGIPYKGTDFSGRSDYGPFIAAGIPSGGLFTGAEGIKTAEEAATWGGTAGIAYDPCYHQACDTYANNNAFALEQNSDAVAYAVLNYAMNTSLINGAKAKGNFRSTASGHASTM